MRIAAALLAAFTLCVPAHAADTDDAARFGARESVTSLKLSPDGRRVAFLTPMRGQGAALVVRGTEPTDKETIALTADGSPERITNCGWVSNARLVCTAYGVVKRDSDPIAFSRVIAVNADGSGMKLLSTRQNGNSRGVQLYGGGVIDWLPETDGSVLMVRNNIPDAATGTRIGTEATGLSVDRIDTATGAASVVERAKADAVEYITDGRGAVRIMGFGTRTSDEYSGSRIDYRFRRKGARDWEPLSTYDTLTQDGFNPYAVDPELDLAYGFRKVAGRQALVSKKLDGSGIESVVFAHPRVDVDGLVRIGRRGRVVGASFVTDEREREIFDPAVAGLLRSLSKALPNTPSLSIRDASLDERRLLVFAGADNDPGTYYIFDRDTRKLQPFLAVREALADRPLASMRALTYPARDGVAVPGYLTLPPGKTSAAGLPAMVLPHGGPSARDEWGFDWLAQYWAARGYAVLQPNFRGSAGYGDAWFQKNGFQSWRTAINDVADAGRYLLAQGADPKRLAIFGWSYGGYAALQSAAVEPNLFRAVVAIAPVTDLDRLKEDRRYWSDYRLVQAFVGSGPHTREGSPAQRAAEIKAPVLIVHGDLDLNVDVGHARLMARRLDDAKVPNTLLVMPGLDHYLDDSVARATMLREADAFLTGALK